MWATKNTSIVIIKATDKNHDHDNSKKIVASFQTLRLVRLLRIFEVFESPRVKKAFKLLHRVATDKGEDILAALLVMFVSLVFIATVMYLVEGGSHHHDEDLDSFQSIPVAMYWGVITLTTIGYGDIYPKTSLGMAICCFVGFFAVCIGSIPIGIIGAGYVEELERSRKEEKVAQNRNLNRHDSSLRLSRQNLHQHTGGGGGGGKGSSTHAHNASSSSSSSSCRGQWPDQHQQQSSSDHRKLATAATTMMTTPRASHNRKKSAGGGDVSCPRVGVATAVNAPAAAPSSSLGSWGDSCQEVDSQEVMGAAGEASMVLHAPPRGDNGGGCGGSGGGGLSFGSSVELGFQTDEAASSKGLLGGREKGDDGSVGGGEIGDEDDPVGATMQALRVHLEAAADFSFLSALSRDELNEVSEMLQHASSELAGFAISELDTFRKHHSKALPFS